MSQSQRSILRKVLVVCELEDNVSEKSASQEYELGINEIVDFPCMVQVVSNIRRAYELTRMQEFDVIVVPQKIQRPFGIKELDACIYTADKAHPNIICILDYEEAEHIFSADMNCKFVRNTEDEETPFDDVADALTSFLFGEAPVEVEGPPPMAHVASSNASSRSATSMVDETVPDRQAKRALPQTNEAASISSSNPTGRPPKMAWSTVYGHPNMGSGPIPMGYPVPMGYAAPAVPSMPHQQRPQQGQDASAWQTMQHQALVMRQQQQQQLHQYYNPRHLPPGPPPQSVSAAPAGASSQSMTHGSRAMPPQPQQQHLHPMVPMQVATPRASASTSPKATPSASSPEATPVDASSSCQVSPSPKKRRFARPRTPTITYGPPTHTAVGATGPGGSPPSAVVSPQKVRQSREPVEVGNVSTPERSPPSPAATAHSSHRAVHSLSEDALDEPEDTILQSTRLLSARSPGQGIDPELLDSFLHDDKH